MGEEIEAMEDFEEEDMEASVECTEELDDDALLVTSPVDAFCGNRDSSSRDPIVPKLVLSASQTWAAMNQF